MSSDKCRNLIDDAASVRRSCLAALRNINDQFDKTNFEPPERLSAIYFKEREVCQKLLEVCSDSMPKIKPLSYIEGLVNDPPTLAVSDSNKEDARDNSDEGEERVGVHVACSHPVSFDVTTPVTSGRSDYSHASSSWIGLYGQK